MIVTATATVAITFTATVTMTVAMTVTVTDKDKHKNKSEESRVHENNRKMIATMKAIILNENDNVSHGDTDSDKKWQSQ